MTTALAIPAAVEISPVDDIPVSPVAWVLLVAFVLAILLVDLLVVHREAKVIPFRDAAVSSAVYMAIGLAFGLVVWAYMGGRASAIYYGGFVLEKSLSIDNVFVWAVIFSYFATPPEFQHRVLFWSRECSWPVTAASTASTSNAAASCGRCARGCPPPTATRARSSSCA